MTIEITSLQHPLVKHLVKVKSDRIYRAQQGVAVIAGKKMIAEIAKYTTIKTLLLIDKNDSIDAAENVVVATQEIIKKVSGLKNPESFVAEVVIPKCTLDDTAQFIVVLENINDPGNMGTLIRTAIALRWDAVILVGDCVDPYNEKALRAAKGATFRMPVVKKTWEELKTFLEERKMPLYIADMGGRNASDVKRLDTAAVLLGSEAHGASVEAKQYGSTIAIPISDEMESLNVAIAGGIILYLLKERTR